MFIVLSIRLPESDAKLLNSSRSFKGKCCVKTEKWYAFVSNSSKQVFAFLIYIYIYIKKAHFIKTTGVSVSRDTIFKFKCFAINRYKIRISDGLS